MGKRSLALGSLLVLAVVLAMVAAGCSDETGVVDSNDADRSSQSGSIQANGRGATASTATAATSSSVATTESVLPDQSQLIWSVVAVELDDTLNVRESPDPRSDIVAELAPWTTSFIVTDEVETNESGSWRLVETDEGEGFVNSRFVLAQPETLSDADTEAMTEQTEALLAWVTNAESPPTPRLGERALWIGGIGVYADFPTPWTWISADGLEAPESWTEVRTIELGPDERCLDCDLSLYDFFSFDRIDDTSRILIDDLAGSENAGYFDGKMSETPSTLHRVVVDTPSTNFTADDGTEQPSLDWQRLHIVFDHSSGQPEIFMLHVHGWTP